MQVCCVWFVDLFRTHKEIALHLDKIVDVHGIIPSNHNVSWGLYFHHCRRSGLGDFLLYLWDSWNATREKEHLERLWDRNLGQQFLFWMCGRHWAISAGIWGTRQSENTNIAGPVALAQVNHFGSRSFNKLVGRCLHMYMIFKRTIQYAHIICKCCVYLQVYIHAYRELIEMNSNCWGKPRLTCKKL